MTTLFYLIASHFICDYPLQSEFIAVGKDERNSPYKGVSWGWIMFAHAITHGTGVALATSNVWLGIAETIAHFNIDGAKCDGMISTNTDQLLHIGCKLLWFAIFLGCNRP